MIDRCFLCSDPVGSLCPGYCDLHGHLVRVAVTKAITSDPPSVEEVHDCAFPGCLGTAEAGEWFCAGHLEQRAKGEPLTPLELTAGEKEAVLAEMGHPLGGGRKKKPAPRQRKKLAKKKAPQPKKKPLVGQHLMRTRIRLNIYDRLKGVADELTGQKGDHVTVSDLVRQACYNLLLLHEAVRRLENAPFNFDEEDDEGEAVIIIENPML